MVYVTESHRWMASMARVICTLAEMYPECVIASWDALVFLLDTYEGRSISNSPDPLPVVLCSWNFACAMIYISMGYVENYSSELIVVSDLQVFELSQVWNGAC